MAKNITPTLKDALAAAATITQYLDLASTSDDEEEPEDEAGEDTVVAEERARLEALGIRALKKEAKEAGFDPADIKAADKDDLVEALVEHFASDDDDAEDDEDEEDPEEDEDDEPGEEDEEEEEEDDSDDSDDSEDEGDDEEEDGYTESALNDMSLGEVKAIVKEAGWTAADIKGKSKDDLIAEYGEHIGFAEGDEDEEGDDDDDDEELDEDALRAMSLKDLKALAKEYDVKVPRGADTDAIVDAILEQAGEDEDDEDEPPF